MKTPYKKNQKGAVLVVCMIILLMLTVIGISGARNILLQEKMTFASRDAQLALQVAETAVRAAEMEINAQTKVTDELLKKNGFYALGAAPSDIFDPDNWTGANSQEVQITMGEKEFTGRYFVELLGQPDSGLDPNVEVSGSSDVIPISSYHIFRIVALGKGLGSTERVIVTHHGLRVDEYENN